MFTLERLPLERVDWKELDMFPDRTIFQTLPWLTFVAKTQHAEPVVAAVREGSATVGYFTGLVVRKYGCRILGSPLPGWTTAYMGFNLASGVPRRRALGALMRFAFSDLRCLHVELMDRRLTPEDGSVLSLDYRPYKGFEIDLSRGEHELYLAMDSDRRRCIRKAETNGVVIEEAQGVDFADDYYAQLREAFARRNLVPTYGRDRARALIDCLQPTGVLLLRARDATGRCIATGIFPAMNDTMYFWGGASWRRDQKLHPNEAIQWHAMRYWKARGIQRYDMGGGGEFKRQYGGKEIIVPWFMQSRHRVISYARDGAKRLLRMKQQLLGRILS